MSEQPITIEKNTVIELSRYTSTDKPSNAEWTSKLIQPIEIHSSDVIMVKQAFIDCRLIDAQSIEVLEDTNLNMDFIYWIQGHGINLYNVVSNGTDAPTFTNLGTEGTVDGLPYVLVDISKPALTNYPINVGRPVIGHTDLFIKKGIYERSGFADMLTRQMEGIKQPTKQQVIDQQFFTAGTVFPMYDINNNFLQFSVPQHPPSVNNIITTFQLKIYLAVWDGVGPAPEYKIFIFYYDSQGKIIRCSLCKMTNYGEYEGIQPGKFLAPCMNTNEFVKAINYDGSTFKVYDGGFIGCNTPSLQYNLNNGDGKFSFQFHTPLISNGSLSVGTYTYIAEEITDPRAYYVSYLNAYSGIMLINIYNNFSYDKPEIPLLNQMGFQRSDLIPPDVSSVFAFNNSFLTPSTTTYFNYYGSFLPYTTRGFMPLSSIEYTTGYDAPRVNSNTPYVMSTAGSIYYTATPGYNFFEATNFVYITASTFATASPSASGHYLIELSGYNNDYINENKIMSVKAIVGNYMYSESFAMTLGPDSFTYTGVGMPFAISSVNVRILNPTTKELAENLGQNSSVYLQIIKQVQI